ncbi:MAG: hypothetical protein NTU70_06000 [Methylococcales bacterium]|nr:hypothetical protein [Methylococcales bacterium]
MEIKQIELLGQTQTEEQKKQQQEKITRLMLNPTQDAEKELIGASSCQHLFKYVSPIEEELEREALSRKHNQELLQKTHQRHSWQQQAHEQMLIRVQLKAMALHEAQKPTQQGNEQVINNTGKGKVNAKSDTKRTRTTNLKRAIIQAVNDIGHKPSFEFLWRYFQDDKDNSGFIEDFTDTHLIWRDTKGNMHDTEKETIRNHLSAITS